MAWLPPRHNAAKQHEILCQRSASVFTTTLTRGEVLYGIWMLPMGERRDHVLWGH